MACKDAMATLCRAGLASSSPKITVRSQRCKKLAQATDRPAFTMSSQILVAEDQVDIRDLIVLNLQQAGYEVTPVADGHAALAQEQQRPSDLLILDLMMPLLDGLDVCKALRAQGRATPILMLTAKSTELDRVLGLELGADDYLTKPFSMAELLARVKEIGRAHV